MICVPIVGPGMQQALKDLHDAESYADLIELRLDLIKESDLKQLIDKSRKPVIVTNRSKKEGGQYKGSEQTRVRSLYQAMEFGSNYIDIEASTPRELLQPILETECQTKKILSYHNFSLTPDNLEDFFSIMAETPADIIKIVTYAKEITDNVVIFNLLRKAQKESKPLIAFCMGDFGEISRILTTIMGGYLTFGALDSGKESAPGQITASNLKNVYRIHRANRDSKIYGVIGNPVNMDGKSGKSSQSTNDFAKNLSRNVTIPISFWDERLSTEASFNITKELGTNVTNRVNKLDENSATFILQGAIDYLSN